MRTTPAQTPIPRTIPPSGPGMSHRVGTVVLVFAAVASAVLLIVGVAMMQAPAETPRPTAPRLITGGPEPAPGTTSGTLILPERP